MRIRHSVPFLLIGTIAVGACGAATVVAPRLAVSQAAENLADLDRFALTASFVGSDDDAIAFFSAGGDEETAEDRDNMLLLKKSELDVAVDHGKLAFDVKVGDIEDAVQARVDGKKLYLRADVAKLAELAKADQADLDGFIADTQKMGLGFIKDAVAGKWISTDLAPLESFAKGMSESGGEVIPGMPAFDITQVQKIWKALGKAWTDNVDVKRVGKEDAGDHLTVSANARRVYTSIKPILGDFGLPFGELPAATEIPDEKYTLDIWVSDKQINRAEFDLTQFVPDYHGGRVALRVDLDRRPDGVSMPDNATSVNLLELFGKFFSGFGQEGADGATGAPEGIDLELAQKCMEAYSKAASPEDVDPRLAAQCETAFAGED